MLALHQRAISSRRSQSVALSWMASTRRGRRRNNSCPMSTVVLPVLLGQNAKRAPVLIARGDLVPWWYQLLEPSGLAVGVLDAAPRAVPVCVCVATLEGAWGGGCRVFVGCHESAGR